VPTRRIWRSRGVHSPLRIPVALVIGVCQHCRVGARLIALLIGTATAASWASLGGVVPSASAATCPDVEVVFARGTAEAPGLGPTGQAFVDSLRSRMGTRSMSVYPVDYPASTDWPTALDGIRDASSHVRSTATNCPNTKMVLGGFSQGAAVIGFVTANVIPDGAPEGVPNPMPADVARHVAAVALFGKPSPFFMNAINQPQIAVGPAYADKTIDLCVTDDPICASGMDLARHTLYAENGMTDQAATFTANRVLASLPPEVPRSTPAPAVAPQSPLPAAPQSPAPVAPPRSPAPAPQQTPAPDGSPQQHQQMDPGTLLRCQTACQVVAPA
jgi:cutinase